MPIASGQVTVTSTITPIAPAAGRNTIIFANTSTTPVYIGDATVTTSTGYLLAGVVGGGVSLDTSAPFYAVTQAGTTVISWLEIS